MKKIAGYFILSISMLLFVVLFIPSIVLYSRKKIWLFCERGNDAQDNAFFFFKWINENHKEINSIFLINKKSKDFEKVSEIGNTCSYKSLKHWLIFISSHVRLSTHLFSYVPGNYLGVFFMKVHKKKGIDVFLQHGITYNFQDCFFRRNNKSDLIICGAEFEYKYLLANYDIVDKLRFTGFPRFDGLINIKTKKNIVLIQPTWRRDYFDLTTAQFMQTDYFAKWNNLINSPRFEKIIKANNFKVLFNIHPSFSKFICCFSSSLGESVKIISLYEDIQQLLKESKILITDYSSILFDFAFLKKPTIYYQFDLSSFYATHYTRGSFDIEKDGFGKTVFNEKDLFDEFDNAILNKCQIKEEYKKRADLFFGEVKDCSQKVYEEIIKY